MLSCTVIQCGGMCFIVSVMVHLKNEERRAAVFAVEDRRSQRTGRNQADEAKNE